MRYVIHQTYDNILALKERGEMHTRNVVKDIYLHFTEEEISAKISEIVRPHHIFADVQVIYQTIEALHEACPKNLGDSNGFMTMTASGVPTSGNAGWNKTR